MGITTFSLFISCQDNNKIKLFAFFLNGCGLCYLNETNLNNMDGWVKY